MEIFIDNGDAVKIGLDIVDGERLSFEDIENNSFSIRKGETELMSGLFFGPHLHLVHASLCAQSKNFCLFIISNIYHILPCHISTI